MNALMTTLLLTGAITSIGAGAHPYTSTTTIESPRLTVSPIGSGFQSPWMYDGRYRPPAAEPISPVAIVAMVIVYVTFLAIIIWAVAIESIQHGRQRNLSSEDGDIDSQSSSDPAADRKSQIDAWFKRDNTEARN